MKLSALLTLFVLLSGTAAQAACYADYKAKQDGPLRLHYGVVEIDGPCTVSNARQVLPGRLNAGGWTLLTVLGTFDENGLDSRKESAGEFFLRF
ncbi:hypothetical protein EU805_01150 [Salipiger sp. IMCC34102]|uniref:hypothetical protein n=1 Tax=Salipiger sp. IMCC34102 TaxID=2510647 RepID=UPI00101D7DE6|nr:hypothetical protein [Salipiger sp. IMCC34102]RYH04008.1 hypothetical protein EU805_01150 [Salipiger sp. IMCC34102]